MVFDLHFIRCLKTPKKEKFGDEAERKNLETESMKKTSKTNKTCNKNDELGKTGFCIKKKCQKNRIRRETANINLATFSWLTVRKNLDTLLKPGKNIGRKNCAFFSNKSFTRFDSPPVWNHWRYVQIVSVTHKQINLKLTILWALDSSLLRKCHGSEHIEYRMPGKQMFIKNHATAGAISTLSPEYELLRNGRGQRGTTGSILRKPASSPDPQTSLPVHKHPPFWRVVMRGWGAHN